MSGARVPAVFQRKNGQKHCLPSGGGVSTLAPLLRAIPVYSGVGKTGVLRRNVEANVEATIIEAIMAVRIRLKRVGAKNSPFYRVVVADGRSPRDGKFIEEIGTYHPVKKGQNFTIDMERVRHWLSKGAQPSDTVASFIRKLVRPAA